jgi:hypothetical protein
MTDEQRDELLVGTAKLVVALAKHVWMRDDETAETMAILDAKGDLEVTLDEIDGQQTEEDR